MEKGVCTKFCGVLISSHEVMKLKVFNPAWVTPYLPMYKTLKPWFSCHIFVDFMEKKTFYSFMVVLTISYQFITSQSFEWLNHDVSDVSDANKHI